MVNNVILFRQQDPFDTTEIDVARRYMSVVEQRAAIPKNSLVIGRYSVLPFYKELEQDINLLGGKLVNSYNQHRYVADALHYVKDLGDLTPTTWFRLEDLPEKGPFVLKGETNSRKHNWNTHMFAKDKQEAIQVALRLREDSLFQNQEIYIRQYIPLKRLATGLNDLPISEEYRFFVLNGRIVGEGFYWSSHIGDLDTIPNSRVVPGEFLTKAINKVKYNIPFFVMDVARTESGEWIVIELNDGQMSGLSEVNSTALYSTIAQDLRVFGNEI